MARGIKKGSVRGMAQPFLEHFASLGLSANEALRRLREMGLGYRRTDFLDDYRKYLGKEKAKDAVMFPSVIRQKDKYQSLISYTYKDLQTGEIRHRNFYIGHDTPLTVGTIESIAGDLISSFADEYEAQPVSWGYRGTRVRIE